MSDPLQLSYKIFMEAEDVSQSRILSCGTQVRNQLANHRNRYLKQAKLDDESDMDEFILRLYVEEQVTEDTCTSREDAEGFIDEFVAFVREIAHVHSFLDMEGEFYISYEGEVISYRFASESGNPECDFTENK